MAKVKKSKGPYKYAWSSRMGLYEVFGPGLSCQEFWAKKQHAIGVRDVLNDAYSAGLRAGKASKGRKR